MLVWSEEHGIDGKTFYRPLEDVVYELLQDPRGKDFLNYEAKPIFLGDKRVFGPLRSAGFWEELEKEHPGKTVVLAIVYSDETSMFTGVSAHPVLGMYCVHICVLCTQFTDMLLCALSYFGQLQRTVQVHKQSMESYDSSSNKFESVGDQHGQNQTVSPCSRQIIRELQPVAQGRSACSVLRWSNAGHSHSFGSVAGRSARSMVHLRLCRGTCTLHTITFDLVYFAHIYFLFYLLVITGVWCLLFVVCLFVNHLFCSFGFWCFCCSVELCVLCTHFVYFAHKSF